MIFLGGLVVGTFFGTFLGVFVMAVFVGGRQG